MNADAAALPVTLEVPASHGAGTGPLPRTGFEATGLVAIAVTLILLGVLGVCCPEPFAAFTVSATMTNLYGQDDSSLDYTKKIASAKVSQASQTSP